MTLDDVRRSLREYLADMAAMDPRMDTTDEPYFREAWEQARLHAKAAAKKYGELVKNEPI